MVERRNNIQQKYESFELYDAVQAIRELVDLGNQHFNENEPWNQTKEEAKRTLANVAFLLRIATELYEPIIPDGAKRAFEALKKKERIILYPRI